MSILAAHSACSVLFNVWSVLEGNQIYQHWIEEIQHTHAPKGFVKKKKKSGTHPWSQILHLEKSSNFIHECRAWPCHAALWQSNPLWVLAAWSSGWCRGRNSGWAQISFFFFFLFLNLFFPPSFFCNVNFMVDSGLVCTVWELWQGVALVYSDGKDQCHLFFYSAKKIKYIFINISSPQMGSICQGWQEFDWHISTFFIYK